MESKVSLNQMLNALDKSVSSKLQGRLKKLSKKKALEKPLDKNKADLIDRKVAYTSVNSDLKKWEPAVEKQKKARHLEFPLNQEPDVLPSTNQALSDIVPSNGLEKEVLDTIRSCESALHDDKELTKAEEKYLKAISVEEAKGRHLELQRMRVLLSSYAAKMRRQKAIKSKSYHRLLKQERLKKHMKKVESDKDLLMDEIERLRRLRAQERASLKHKNTGKWAKHAKFRAKYDEEARKALLDQIGIAGNLLEKPVQSEDSDDECSMTESGSESESEDETAQAKEQTQGQPIPSRLIVSSDLLHEKTNDPESSCDENGDDDDDDDDQRKLIGEAFGDDDVVSKFREEKKKLTEEEQPKAINLTLPGWGTWTGPGIKSSKRSKRKTRPRKLPRKDDKLGNVIISEKADAKIAELQVRKVPRGFSEKKLASKLSRPTASSFCSQTEHRRKVQPRITTKLGARIEPMNKRAL